MAETIVTLNRLENEDDFTWKMRLISQKIERLSDFDWSEIRDALGLQCSPDHLRKTAYGLYEAKRYYEEVIGEIECEIEGISEAIDGDSESMTQLEIIRNERRELEKAKIQYRDQKREDAAILRAEARLDNIKAFIQETASHMSSTKMLNLEKKPISVMSNKEGVLLLSDWHYSMVINNFVNKYDTDEFRKRLELLIDKTIEYGLQHQINTLHVCDLGDLCSGIIHHSIRVTSSEDVVTQTMNVAEMLCEVLVSLAEVFPNIKFYSVLDNHSRVTQNKDDSLATESFARFIPWYIKSRLAHIPNIYVVLENVDEDIAVFDVCGHTCFMVHGHRDKVDRVAKELPMMLRIFPDYIFMSHYHHLAQREDHGCEIIVNSSMMGTDDYAKHLRVSAKPSQSFMVFDEEGKICQYNIVLSRR